MSKGKQSKGEEQKQKSQQELQNGVQLKREESTEGN
jgi:hypothetical protein